MNDEREWISTCLYGQQDIWAEWVRIGERLADTQEASGWGTPYALRLLNEQNARWLEATQHWLGEWERIAQAHPELGYGGRQALLRNRIFQTWLDTVSGLDWDQWHLSMRQAFLLLQQAFQAAQAAQIAPAAAPVTTTPPAPADAAFAPTDPAADAASPATDAGIVQDVRVA